MKFGQRPCTIVQGLWADFGATLKFRKKSNFDQNQFKLKNNIRTCICIRKNYKKWNSPVAIFHEIWPRPCTIVQGLSPSFGATLKFRKKLNFNQNQFKLKNNIRTCTCICIRKIYKKWNSPVAIFHEIWPKTMYYSTGTFTRFWSNFKIS